MIAGLKDCPSYTLKIHIAGDVKDAERSCREFCRDNPCCVTVTPTEYIYTGGQESGVLVTLINYPRFPRTTDELEALAYDLVQRMLRDLCQESATIEANSMMYWFSNRPDGESPSKRS